MANLNAYNSTLNAADSLRRHWPEYLMEAGEAACYLFAACSLATLLWHPASPLQAFLRNDATRRMLMGAGMGAAIILIVFPLGENSPARISTLRSHWRFIACEKSRHGTRCSTVPRN